MISHLVVGSINWDVLLFLKKFPSSGEEVSADFIFESPGGKGGNISVASSKILGNNEVGLLSIMGNDLIGRKHIKMLRNKGVITDFIIRHDKIESGKAFVIIDSKGRNLIITKKNNDAVIDEILNEKNSCKLMETIAELKAITITDLPINFIEKLLSYKHNKKRLIIWIPGLRSNLKLIKLAKLFNQINYLVLNESESFQLTNCHESVNACKKIMGTNKDLGVIITLGENGCLYAKNDQITKIPTINLSEMGLLPVNTAGSGDVFAGTFSSLKILNYEDKDAIQLALLAGSIKVTKKEIQACPNLNQILQFIKKYKINFKYDLLF